ncbi:MAG: AbiH family protein [Ignavibacteriaceae bacterium]|jgi:hypothetical protein|nr:AbiH family protein [Ignavibacteriaceae bacterium]
MVELVIIGNGFDRAHGYETLYSHFLEGYIRKRYNLFEESGGVTVEDDLIIINNWVDPKYYKGKISYDKLDFTHKHNFFKEILNNHKDSNWEGIEREYFKHLYKLVTTSEKADTNNKVKLLNECLTNIKKELIEYLEDKTPKNILSIDLNGSILDYLNILIEKCKVDIKEKTTGGEVSDYKIVLLNFNYTYTAKACFDHIEKQGIKDNVFIINIHGTLGDKNSIIFGYGDESDKRYSELEEIGDKDILSNFKSFDYFHSRAYSKLIGLLDKQNYNIHIMGHSCGVSDRVLLKELFCKNNCKKIQIYYNKRDDGSNDYKEKTMNISRIFPLDQKAAMRKKIVNIKDCKPL